MELSKGFHRFLFEASYPLVGKASVIKYYKEFMETQCGHTKNSWRCN